MNKNKIGTIFFVSVLALAGIGISYAGLTDELNIYGTVTTGTVDLNIHSYSGTWVWKVYDAPGEIVITTDPTYTVPPDQGFLVSYAEGRPATIADPTDPNNNNEPYDAVLEFSNLFPCIDFMADIVFHYDGTIPAKVSNIDWDWVGEAVTLPNGDVITDDFIDWLMTNGHMTGGFYRCDENGNLLAPLEEVGVGYQLHQCNYFKLIVTIHLPQENWLQGLEGNGYVNIGVLQWNDQCEEEQPFDIEITKVSSTEKPFVDTPFTYTITAHNLGPGDASGVIVNDLLSDSLQYISDNPSKGIYDHVTGDWNIGDLAAGETATLEITVEFPLGAPIENTQLALLLDGSGSISSSDWTVMLNGIATAIEDGYIPHNGQVELTVIQFGGWAASRSWAQVELEGPIVLDSTNYLTVAGQIQAISHLGGGTAMSCAFRLAADVMSGDPNGYLAGTPFAGMASTHSDWPRQVVNLVTDGQPNIIYIHDERYAGSWPSGPNEYVLGKADTELALTYFESIVPISVGDEIDSEAVGTATDIPWLRDHVVRPQPGNLAPPFIPGWVKSVATYTALATTLKEKFQILFQQIDNCATLIEPVDIDPSNNQDCVNVLPQIPD